MQSIILISSNIYKHKSVSLELSSAGIKIAFGPFEDYSSNIYMPQLEAHGRSPIITCIRLCPMVILVFLPFHHLSVDYVSVIEAYYNPELDHVRKKERNPLQEGM